MPVQHRLVGSRPMHAVRRRRAAGRLSAALAVASLLGSLIPAAPAPVAPVALAGGVTTLWVDAAATSSPPGTGCGASAAYTSIETAVNATGSNAVVHICQGTYTLTSEVTINEPGLTIVGDGSTNTVIDGGGTTRLFVDVSGSVTFQDLTLRRAWAPVKSCCDDPGWGGAVYGVGTVSLSRVRFESNGAEVYGGAIAALSVSLTDGTFTDNSAGTGGGAIYTPEGTGSVRIDGSFAFARNHAGLGGGAIAALADDDSSGSIGTTVVISGDGRFEENTAGTDVSAGSGGAIYTWGFVRINVPGSGGPDLPFAGPSALAAGGSTLFLRNRVTGPAAGGGLGAENPLGSGGAIAAAGTLAVSSRFEENRARAGGAIWSFATAVAGSDFSSNTAVDETSAAGGAIVAAISLSFDSTFTLNSASDGGAVWAAAVLDRGSTFRGNRAGHDGGAVFIWPEPLFPSQLEASTFLENSAGSDGGAIAASAAIVELSAATFIENTAGSNGGAVLAPIVRAFSPTFLRNRAVTGSGGAIGTVSWCSGDQNGVSTGLEDFAEGRPGLFEGNAAGGDGGAIGLVLRSCPEVSSGSVSGVIPASRWLPAIDPATVPARLAALGLTDKALAGLGFRSLGAPSRSISDGLAQLGTVPGVSAPIGSFGPRPASTCHELTLAIVVTFRDNTAGTSGDGGAISTSCVFVILSTLSGNRAGARGGAIRASEQAVTLTSTLVANRAVAGPGGAVSASDGVAIASTLVDNSSGTGASALEVSGGALIASLLVAGAGTTCTGTMMDVGGTLDTGSGCANAPDSTSGVSRAALRLDPAGLARNGAPLADWPKTIAIRAGSLATGYGSLMACDSSLPFDQRVSWRHTTLPTPAAYCSSGAYEFERTASTIVTAVSSATVGAGRPVHDRATIRGSASDGSGGSVVPTGSVDWYVCDGTTCSTDGFPLGTTSVVPGIAGSGVSSASSGDLTTGELALGTYTFHAVYLPDAASPYYPSEDTGGTSERFTIGLSSVTLAYTGPTWLAGLSDGTVTTSLTATVSPVVEGCTLLFSIDEGDPTTATVAANGIATTGAVTLPAGAIYSVSVSTGDGCSGAGDTGVLTVAAGSLTRGSQGGGWYRSALVNPSKISLGYIVAQTSQSTDRKTGATTTGWKGQLLWVAKAGWRIKTNWSNQQTRYANGTTAGIATWVQGACPTTYGDVSFGTSYRCGTFTGTGVLDRWDPSLNGGRGDWRATRTGVVFVVTVFDGGSASVCRTIGKKKSCTTTDLADYAGIALYAPDGSAITSGPPTDRPIVLNGQVKVY